MQCAAHAYYSRRLCLPFLSYGVSGMVLCSSDLSDVGPGGDRKAAEEKASKAAALKYELEADQRKAEEEQEDKRVEAAHKKLMIDEWNTHIERYDWDLNKKPIYKNRYYRDGYNPYARYGLDFPYNYGKDAPAKEGDEKKEEGEAKPEGDAAAAEGEKKEEGKPEEQKPAEGEKAEEKKE